MEPISILLVDDEPSIRRGLRMRLELEPDMTVVGEAADGAAALERALDLGPRVVLMDIEMPRMDGIEATRSLRGRSAAPAVVVLSMHDDAATRDRAREAGAVAFVAKNSIDGALLDAIRRAAQARGEEP